MSASGPSQRNCTLPANQRKFTANEQYALAVAIADGKSTDEIARVVDPPLTKYGVHQLRAGLTHRAVKELADQISQAHTDRLIRLAALDAVGLYAELRNLARNKSGSVPPDVQRAAIVDGLNLATARAIIPIGDHASGAFGPTDMAQFVKALITEEPDAATGTLPIDPTDDSAIAGSPDDSTGPAGGSDAPGP